MMHSLPLQTRQTLKALGFSDNECKVLLPLFAQRKMRTKELSQQTVLSFDTVHYTLHALEKKGLIKRTARRGEDVVEICSNRAFLQWIEMQKHQNAEIYNEAEAVLQTFLTTLTESSWKPDIMYFEGKQGLIDIYKDMLQEGQNIFGWTDIQKIQETIGDYMEEFIKQRIKKGIISSVIMPTRTRNSPAAKKHQTRNIRRFATYLNIDGEIRIYGNKVAVITFQRSKPVGFVFSSSVITAIFRGIFDHAWKSCANEENK